MADQPHVCFDNVNDSVLPSPPSSQAPSIRCYGYIWQLLTKPSPRKVDVHATWFCDW